MGGITRECPELKAIVSMARALTRIVYPDSDGPGAEYDENGPSAVNTSSRCFAESAMGYILNVIHHFPELRHQTRSLSSLYGVIGRLARLTTEAGNLEATLALYTFIPLRDRRLSPWSIIAKQMADCAAFGLGHPAVIEAPQLVGMKGRAELGLLLMRAEGQRGDQSGGMSPLSLINAVISTPKPSVDLQKHKKESASILYDPYLQFTPPIDETPTSEPEAGTLGVVDVPPEVIGHALKALLLPHSSPEKYSAPLREVTSRRAMALAPALLTSMGNKAQYPTWPLTLLIFAAGGLPKAAQETQSLHYQIHLAHLASLHDDQGQIEVDKDCVDWVPASMACLTELDANLLLASLLSDIAEDAQERAKQGKYLTAVLDGMKRVGFRLHSSIMQK